MGPDLVLRNAIISFYWGKNINIIFLTEYKIKAVRIIYKKYNDSYKRVVIIEPCKK